jgi:CRISPR-associated endonuclease/helicase Cas3
MKPLPFSRTLAHPPNDLLAHHLERVAIRAYEAIAPSAQAETRLIALLAGLFHDIGKATFYFQHYLTTQKRTALTSHAASSATLAWWYTGEMALPLWIRLAIFIAILRHHGQLNYNKWQQPLSNIRYDIQAEPSHLIQQLTALDLEGIHDWLEQLKINQIELPTQLPPLTVTNIEAQLKQPKGSELRKAFSELEQAVMFLAGFGSLLVVDKIDAALQGDCIQRQEIPAQAVQRFKSNQSTHFSATTELNKRREHIATEVVATWLAPEHLHNHLFSLTAPTGAGKTLTILNAALAVRAKIAQQQGYTPRIIYCLPFTSVIDQNHAIYHRVFQANGLANREDLLLKHHHLVTGIYRRQKATEDIIEHQPDGEGQLLTESWQSELVVTTFYQLLHSLLSNQNAELKRAGQLTGSIVLMDEVQAIPIKYWQTLQQLFQTVAQVLGTRLVLLTATKPLIFPASAAVELLPHHTEHFQALSRVQLHWHHAEQLTLADFAEQLINQHQADERSILVIVNRIRSVQRLFEQLVEAFPNKTVLALSNYLTPRERRIRIYLIQRLLRQNKPCLVIATQLVEAGVDISFPVIHRELAPLDSVIQSAGRCNRHNEGKIKGTIHLWRLYETNAEGHINEHQPLYHYVYDQPLINATESVLGQQSWFQEHEFLQLSENYFKACWDPTAQWNRIGQESVHQWLQAGDFIKVAEQFNLILEKGPKRTIFIIGKTGGTLRHSDHQLWQTYEQIHHDDQLSPLAKEQAFAKIRTAFYDRVIHVNERPDPDESITKVEASEATYTREIGFLALPKEPAACFF